jgi:AraC-like DNA-binding protein
MPCILKTVTSKSGSICFPGMTGEGSSLCLKSVSKRSSMNLHLSDNLTIGELSNRLAVSPSTLERITRREFGCSVMELYHQLKINRACSLIMNSDMTMKQIADSLGFFDQAHFSRFFKQKMNITPLQFKKTASI